MSNETMCCSRIRLPMSFSILCVVTSSGPIEENNPSTAMKHAMELELVSSFRINRLNTATCLLPRTGPPELPSHMRVRPCVGLQKPSPSPTDQELEPIELTIYWRPGLGFGAIPPQCRVGGLDRSTSRAEASRVTQCITLLSK